MNPTTAGVQTSHKEKDKKIKKLEDELTPIRVENSKLKEELEKMKNENFKLSSEIEKKLDEFNQLHTQNKNLQGNIFYLIYPQITQFNFR